MKYKAIWTTLALLAILLAFAPVSFALPQSHSVTLNWINEPQPSAETVAQWNVYRSPANGAYALLASLPVATVTYEDTSVLAGNSYSYVLTAVDTAGIESLYSGSVNAAIPQAATPVSISTSALQAATVGVPYNITLSASGGSAPYTWSGSGVPGLTVSSTGVLSGTPSQAGTFTETAIVTDSAGATASVSLPLNIAAPTQTSGLSPTPPAGLALYWTFDNADISNRTVTDKSGNGNTGILFGSPASVPGVLNQALSFNGSSSYAAANGGVGALTRSLSLSAWINTSNASRTEAIFSNFDASGTGAGYVFTTDQNGHVDLRLGGADIAAYPNYISDVATINDSQWHHVVATISFEQQIVQFYVDGQPTSSAAVSLVPNGNGGASLQVGVNPYTGYGDYFTGAIDEVQVYNRALTASDVNALFLAAETTNK